MSQKNISKWIEEALVPQILKHDELRGATVRKTEVKSRETMKDNWASDMFEINLFLQCEGDNQELALILKVMSEDEQLRKAMLSDKQFFNEIHFYSTAVPLILSILPSENDKRDFEKIIPKCYYTYYNTKKKPETYEDGILIMENLKVRGFKLGDRSSLDLKHFTLALQRLGAFHAFSYYMKERYQNTFMTTIVNPIHETFYVESNKKPYNSVFPNSQRRVIDGLVAELPHDDPGLARLRDLASKNAFNLLTKLVKPQEPLSVLCHGDFLRNNLLFQYDNGEPTDVKFIDFQMVRYASPAIDISLFICMNTTHELRVAHFDELLQVYHTSLTETLSTLFEKSSDQLDQRYSFESFLADFREHAVYGYLVAIEFLPRMLATPEELNAILRLYFNERGSPKYNELARVIGGDRATRVMMDLAKDLIHNRCL